MLRFFLYSSTIFGLFIIGVIIYFYVSTRGLSQLLIEYQPKQSSQILDRNEKLIAYVFEDHHRIYATYEEIPSKLIESLLAIEDTKFFEHKGINLGAIFRAFIKNLINRRVVEGASTITQQLVKTVLLTNEKTFTRKIKEAILSLEIDATLSKEKILEIYFNEIFLGHGYYGVRTAAKGYFRKELKDLTLAEMAILVSLPKSPTRLDPTKNMQGAMFRAHKVISRLEKLGWIDESDYKQAMLEIPKIYNETLTLNKAPYVVDEVLRRLKKYEDIKTGAYKIHLSIDLKSQQIAQKALKYGYSNIVQRDKDTNSTKLNGSIVVIQQSSGDILAMVGGIDHKESSFNRATQAIRQPGSSVKPFIFQIALNHGYSPTTRISDVAMTYGKTDKTEKELNKDENETKIWKPKNYDKTFNGRILLEEALVSSRNLATINLVDSMGLNFVCRKMHSFGFHDFPCDMSISLGSFGVTLMEMSKYYSIISNYGSMVEPILIKKIVTKNNIVTTFENNITSLIEPKQAFLMIDLLTRVIKKGTGRRAMVRGIDLGGKTGTTDRYADAWFCGFSPDVQTIVWFGNDDNTKMYHETGGRAAAPTFEYFNRHYLRAYPNSLTKFHIPEGVREVNGYYYTDISQPPKIENKQREEEIVF
jgi:penicillin-binding protein 1A